MKIFRVFLLICAFAVGAAGCDRQGSGGVSRNVEIIGHRGASYLAPENSMSAVMLGWEKGADVEVDVYLTKDERIVVIHDKTTKRTGDRDLTISETGWEELRTVDVGRFKSEDFAGERMPLLEEVVATIPEGRKLYVEIKCGQEILPFLEEMIEASGKRGQIVIIAFDFDTIVAAKKRMGDVGAYWLKGTEKDKVTRKYIGHGVGLVEKVEAAGLDGLDVHYAGVTDKFAAAVKDAGLGLYVWTVDDPEDAALLIELGVDGITTNRPGWLEEKLGAAEAME